MTSRELKDKILRNEKEVSYLENQELWEIFLNEKQNNQPPRLRRARRTNGNNNK
jgi:hypothetical protein